MIFEVKFKEGSRQFYEMRDLESLKKLLDDLNDQNSMDGQLPRRVRTPQEITEVVGTKEEQLNYVMSKMQESWRYHWCGAGMCGCMGCVNVSGSLVALGFKQADWQAWVDRNPRQDQGASASSTYQSLGDLSELYKAVKFNG